MKLAGSRQTRSDLLTYLLVILAFAVAYTANAIGVMPRSLSGQLIPVCCYIVMAVSLNLVVGIAGDLSLGHAGFMSVGAFSGIVTSMSLSLSVDSIALRILVSVLVGATLAGIVGFVIGFPVMRLRGDYLAIVTLAFGEIIKEIINNLLVGYDANGLHVIFNINGDKGVADLNLLEGGVAIIKGAQGASGTSRISTFVASFILVMVALVVVLNLVRSRTGRAIMAVRDNRIAAESVGISTFKYRMIAFVVAAALAGAAGAIYGNSYSQLSASKFDFNTSILVLVFVVLGGLGNVHGSIIAAALLTVLPEMLRSFSNYRMLAYAIVLIAVMLATNNETLRGLWNRAGESLSKTRLASNAVGNHATDSQEEGEDDVR